jgi:5-methylcytosine-specific restriction endonuclease McrA
MKEKRKTRTRLRGEPPIPPVTAPNQPLPDEQSLDDFIAEMLAEPLEPQRPSKGLNLNAPSVLVLNASFEPLHVCSIKRAVTLIMCEVAERVENSPHFLHSPSTAIPVPSVIRLKKYVRRPPRYHIAFNRRNVFRRDNNTCQYCGHIGGDLTLDHILPRSRGGRSLWENIVTACRECNTKKRDRTPDEAAMKLLRQPYAPRFVFSTAYGQPPRLDANWEKYLG